MMIVRFLHVLLVGIFFLSGTSPFSPVSFAQAQIPSPSEDDFVLPKPGSLVDLSPAYEPALLKGLTVHKDNPFLFDFILDTGHSQLGGKALKQESNRLVKYFFACLTIPEKDLWVNLSPYEKDRIIPSALGQTAMGKDLLAQDYMLKQLTASLIYPEKDLGKDFWETVYSKARLLYGTTQIPVNTFNKVWILADRATVYEHDQTAFVVEKHLKVMLEEDYLSWKKHEPIGRHDNVHNISSQIIREIIIPEIEKEVNSGRNFATLRQIFNSLILAIWYKKNLKQALLTQVYANKSTVNGINGQDPAVKASIYQQYLKAYKKGVFNYIKEDVDPVTKEMMPRKYFSGGFVVSDHLVSQAMSATTAVRMPTGQFIDLKVLTHFAEGNPVVYPPVSSFLQEFERRDDQIIGVSIKHPSLGIRIILKSTASHFHVTDDQPVDGVAELVYINKSKSVLVPKQRTVYINPAHLHSLDDIKFLLDSIFGVDFDFKPWFEANQAMMGKLYTRKPQESLIEASDRIIFPKATMGAFDFGDVKLDFDLSRSPQELPDYAKREMIGLIFRGQTSIRIRRSEGSTGFILSIPEKGIKHRLNEALFSTNPPAQNEITLKWDQIEGDSISGIFNSINSNLPPTFPSLWDALPKNAPIRFLLDLDRGKGRDSIRDQVDSKFRVENFYNASILGVNKRFRKVAVEVKFYESPKLTFSGLRIINGSRHEYLIGIPKTVRTKAQLEKMLNVLLDKADEQVDFELKPIPHVVVKTVLSFWDTWVPYAHHERNMGINVYKKKEQGQDLIRVRFTAAFEPHRIDVVLPFNEQEIVAGHSSLEIGMDIREFLTRRDFDPKDLGLLPGIMQEYIYGNQTVAVNAAQLVPSQKKDIVDGGIDLTQSQGFRLKKDANGGVQVDFDPAMIQRIRREGVYSVVPVIISMTHLLSVSLLLDVPSVN
jgi:hypothetical protein